MEKLDLNKKIDGMTLGDLASVMIVVVKEALQSDFEKIIDKKFKKLDKKFEKLNKKLDYMESEIKTIKLTQNYIKETGNIGLEKPLDSISLASFLADEKEENSYFKLFR